MIRYAKTLAEIEAEIDRAVPTWRERARERTALFRSQEQYTETFTGEDGRERKAAPFWGEIKPVFMRLQYHKCIYCETQLEGGPSGTIQWDLEHFRPKGRVRRWPPANQERRYRFATGDESDRGYYLLAYHPGNYAAACKTCNTPFKSDYFPIAGPRMQGSEHPAECADEKPYLVYPIGTDDEDPQNLIAFEGVTAVPRQKRGIKNRRGKVMIDFFDLNRDPLQSRRAWWLYFAVWPAFRDAEDSETDGIYRLHKAQSLAAPFTNCVRCFVRLCETDRAAALRELAKCRLILDADGT